MSVYIIISTAPKGAGEKIAKTLVEERKIACVNIIKDVKSFFVWKGEVNREDEEVLIMKTSGEKVREVMERIREIHPYEVPEILYFRVDGSEDYISWVYEVVG